jgi:type III secretion system YscQ/HrcQ family protein
MNRDGSAKPLEWHLEHADPALAALANRWIERRQVASMRVGAHAFGLRWMPAPPAAPRGGVSFDLESQQRRATLWLADLAAIDARLVGEPFAALPTPIKDLVAQRLLADFIAALPPALAATVQLRALQWHAAPRPDGAPAIAFALTREADGVSTEGLWWTESLADLQWLEGALPTGAAALPPPQQSDLPLAATLHLGRMRVAAAALRRLEAGDVVRLARGSIVREGIVATLRVAGRTAMQWPCRVRRDRAQIVAAVGDAPVISLSLAPPARRELPPLQEKPPMSAAAPSLDFEVPVDVELAQLSLTLAQIERLLPGQSVELPQDVSDAAVTLRVQGQAIAEGKLIVIGRALGVRVERTFVGAEGAKAALKPSAAPSA